MAWQRWLGEREGGWNSKREEWKRAERERLEMGAFLPVSLPQGSTLPPSSGSHGSGGNATWSLRKPNVETHHHHPATAAAPVATRYHARSRER